MGAREKEFINCYRKMKAEKQGTDLTSTDLAILTAAGILKEVMEKCTTEICRPTRQEG